MWIIAALVRNFDVTVYTRSGFDLLDLNRLAGTDLVPSDLDLRMAEVETRLPIGALAAGAFVRSLHRVGRAYDLRVTASGVLPWGHPALHFLSSLQWNPQLADRLTGFSSPRLRRHVSSLLISLTSGVRRDLSQDIFVANSDWLRRLSEPVCPGPVRVIHPVVPSLTDGLEWEDRQDAVLVFGRISPEKRIESCIRIVERARAAGFPGRLILAGPDGEASYAAGIRAQVRPHDWIDLLPNQRGADKTRLLGSVKYGLNCCVVEAFGISTGEMASCGVVTLVPDDTGQREIIDDVMQTFASEEQAADRLIAIIRSPDVQRRLHAKARAVRGRFAPDRFAALVREAAQQRIEASASFEVFH